MRQGRVCWEVGKAATWNLKFGRLVFEPSLIEEIAVIRVSDADRRRDGWGCGPEGGDSLTSSLGKLGVGCESVDWRYGSRNTLIFIYDCD